MLTMEVKVLQFHEITPETLEAAKDLNNRTLVEGCDGELYCWGSPTKPTWYCVMGRWHSPTHAPGSKHHYIGITTTDQKLLAEVENQRSRQ